MPIISPLSIVNRARPVASAAAPPAGFEGWNAADANQMAVSGDNDEVATATASSGSYIVNIRGTTGRSAGLRCFAITMTEISTGDDGFGVAPTTDPISDWVGNIGQGWGYWKGGNAYTGGSPTATGVTWAEGDYVMCAVNFTSGKLWWGKNGTWIGDPAADTGNTYSSVSGTLHVMCGTTISGHIFSYKGHSSNLPFTPPAGFTAWED